MNTSYNFLREYVPVRDAFKTREDGEFLIVSNREQAIYYLNGMTREIWNMFDGHISIEKMCNRIFDEYDVTRKKLESDIVNLVRDLQHKRLIRMKGGVES